MGAVLRRCVAAAALLLAGCAAPGTPPPGRPEVSTARLGAVLHQPVWSYRTGSLLGLTDDHRLADVGDPQNGSARTRRSAPIATGRNLQISRADDRQAFVPQPDRGKVAVVDLASLTEVDAFDAGPAPAYLAEDAGLRVLLALSADGSAVTPVEEHGHRVLPTARIDGPPADTVDGANRGRVIGYHLYGPWGIRYLKGPSAPPQLRGALALDVAVSAGDGTQVERSYVAGHDDNVLYAVESRRGGDGLQVVGSARLSALIRYLGTDDTRIYAATDRDLTVLPTASFTGYPAATLPVLRVIDYRAALPAGPVRAAPLSGLAVGPDHVYLTVRDHPIVIAVTKPRL